MNEGEVPPPQGREFRKRQQVAQQEFDEFYWPRARVMQSMNRIKDRVMLVQTWERVYVLLMLEEKDYTLDEIQEALGKNSRQATKVHTELLVKTGMVSRGKRDLNCHLTDKGRAFLATIKPLCDGPPIEDGKLSRGLLKKMVEEDEVDEEGT